MHSPSPHHIPPRVRFAKSNAALVPLLAGWVRDRGFDGIYLDECRRGIQISRQKPPPLCRIYASRGCRYRYFETFRTQAYLGGYPDGTKFDATGDGRPDEAAAIEAQYLKYRPLFTAGLRAALGPDAIMVANTIGVVH